MAGHTLYMGRLYNMEIYIVEGYSPSFHDSGSPIKAFYNENRAKEFCIEMSEKAQNLEQEMKSLYSYLDDEFPVTSQDSIKRRSEYLISTNILQEISDKYPDIPANCTAFDYYEIDLE